MDMTGLFPLLWWALGGATVLGAAVFAFMEYQAYLLRTSVTSVPGGLRFTAQGFTVESQHSAKSIKVTAKSGVYARQVLPNGEEEQQTGQVTPSFQAAGLRMEVARISVKGGDESAAVPTGLSRIAFTASDELVRKSEGKPASERSRLVLDDVPDSIASDFQQFANGLRVWIDKVELRVEAEIEALRQREAEAAAAALALLIDPAEDTSVPLTEAEREARVAAQIGKWRAVAGFKGTSTEVNYDARGHIVWFIDLDPAGRIILHAGKRTFHGSLKGALVVGIGSELEISVLEGGQDGEDPRVARFRVLGGASPESRRAWKERLDLLIQGLGPAARENR
jgi:hypothetical protein